VSGLAFVTNKLFWQFESKKKRIDKKIFKFNFSLTQIRKGKISILLFSSASKKRLLEEFIFVHVSLIKLL
jgi:hypothetical protein